VQCKFNTAREEPQSLRLVQIYSNYRRIMTCSVLTSLPDSIISVIMTSWLTSTDLGRLDAASCSTLDRQAFLSTLTIDTVTVNFNDEDRPPPPSEEKWDMYVNFLRWTTLRGGLAARPGYSYPGVL
jgi:hypothetical protein